jgi:hypothetical protein
VVENLAAMFIEAGAESRNAFQFLELCIGNRFADVDGRIPSSNSVGER